MFAIVPAEALAVGIFARRGKSPLLAGALVWGAAALSLVAAPSLYGVGYLRETIWSIAMQTMLSGLVAVVLADLLAAGSWLQRLAHRSRPAESRHLRSYAFHAFLLVATLPVLLLAAVDNQLTAAKREADGGARLHEAVDRAGRSNSRNTSPTTSTRCEAWRSRCRTRSSSRPIASGWSTSCPKIYPGFITLFVADRRGIVREIFPPRAAADTPPITDRAVLHRGDAEPADGRCPT